MRTAYSYSMLTGALALAVVAGCGDDVTTVDTDNASETGDGDGDGDGDGAPGDGDGAPGDGDGAPGDGDGAPGDGDGAPGDGDGAPGDGDGAPGDGDGAPGDGDGDGDGAPAEACDLLPAPIDFTLTGSMQPPGSCGDYVFTGQLEGGGGGVWNLDACPCGVFCFAPDPYVLTLSIPDLALVPTPVMCPKIEIRRDPDTCAPLSVVIRDLDDNEAVEWIAGREAAAPAGVAELSVTPTNATQCPGDVDQYALEFAWLDEAVAVSQGDSAMLVADPDWTVKNYAAQMTDGGEDFAWVMKR